MHIAVSFGSSAGMRDLRAFSTGGGLHGKCFAQPGIEALPVFEDGTEAVPQYLPDIGYSHCLKRINVGWHVILDLSRTDVPSGDEVRKIKKSFPGDFPVSILPEFWHDLFRQSK